MNNDLPPSWKFEEVVTINCEFHLLGLKMNFISVNTRRSHYLVNCDCMRYILFPYTWASAQFVMLMKLCSFCASYGRHLCHGSHVLRVPPHNKTPGLCMDLGLRRWIYMVLRQHGSAWCLSGPMKRLAYSRIDLIGRIDLISRQQGVFADCPQDYALIWAWEGGSTWCLGNMDLHGAWVDPWRG